MDPLANIQEQRELAAAIIAKFDAHANDDGLPDELGEIAYQAEELSRLVLALDGWRKAGGLDPYTGHKQFRTADGYTLHRSGTMWQDSLHEAEVDMTFDQDKDGWPVDDNHQRLEGSYQ
jgi:hypothetical protein